MRIGQCGINMDARPGRTKPYDFANRDLVYGRRECSAHRGHDVVADPVGERRVSAGQDAAGSSADESARRSADGRSLNPCSRFRARVDVAMNPTGLSDGFAVVAGIVAVKSRTRRRRRRFGERVQLGARSRSSTSCLAVTGSRRCRRIECDGDVRGSCKTVFMWGLGAGDSSFCEMAHVKGAQAS